MSSHRRHRKCSRSSSNGCVGFVWTESDQKPRVASFTIMMYAPQRKRWSANPPNPGKSNILVPLWKLNPANDGEIDLTADYPRKNYNEFRSLIFNIGEDLAGQLSTLVEFVRQPTLIRKLVAALSRDCLLLSCRLGSFFNYPMFTTRRSLVEPPDPNVAPFFNWRTDQFSFS
jgi:hypothetical protein